MNSTNGTMVLIIRVHTKSIELISKTSMSNHILVTHTYLAMYFRQLQLIETAEDQFLNMSVLLPYQHERQNITHILDLNFILLSNYI